MLDKPGQYSSRIGQLRTYAGYLDEEINDAALIISKRELPEQDAAYIAGLVRISKLGQVLAYQAGDLCEIIHQLEEKGIELSDESKEAIRHSLVPGDMNLKTLAESFPEITETVNNSMRDRDEILRDIMTLQFRQYLQRFASRRSPAGSMFSRVLFQIEEMAATIREIRKSARLLQNP
jgi:Na+/phosphate symporter